MKQQHLVSLRKALYGFAIQGPSYNEPNVYASREEYDEAVKEYNENWKEFYITLKECKDAIVSEYKKKGYRPVWGEYEQAQWAGEHDPDLILEKHLYEWKGTWQGDE